MIASKHIFDCSFVYPDNFMQLLVDKEIQKREPGCFKLINNKSEKSYKLALSSFKIIIAGDNKIGLSLISYIFDY